MQLRKDRDTAEDEDDDAFMRRITILPGPFMTEEELKQAIAALEARAKAAQRNSLPKTAKSWRDAIENMRGRVGEHDGRSSPKIGE
jgi:hypothetical protein